MNNHVHFVVRSQEYTDGQEFGNSFLPDHYVKRLWRKKSSYPGGSSTTAVSFINKDDEDEGVVFSALDQDDKLVVKGGKFRRNSNEVARVEWVEEGSGASIDKSMFTLGNKTGRIRDLLKKSGTFSKSRTFMGPDGLTYKWKYVVAGSNPTFPEGSHWTLYGPNTEHPIATTQRLVERDNSTSSYPLYLADSGMMMAGWIVATLLVIDKITQ